MYLHLCDVTILISRCLLRNIMKAMSHFPSTDFFGNAVCSQFSSFQSFITNYTDKNVHLGHVVRQPPIRPATNHAPLTTNPVRLWSNPHLRKRSTEPHTSLHDNQTNIYRNYHSSARQLPLNKTLNQCAVPTLSPRQEPLFTIFPEWTVFASR